MACLVPVGVDVRAGVHVSVRVCTREFVRVRVFATGIAALSACAPGPTGGGTDPTDTVVLGPGSDSSSPGKFDGPSDSSNAPTLVYPAPGTLVPPNLSRMEFHFRPGAGQTLFRLTYQGVGAHVDIYLGCEPLGDGCFYSTPADVWNLIGQAEKGNPPGEWSVAGVDGDDPGAVGTSERFVFGVGPEDIVGGLYYWNVQGGRIMRYDFGLATANAEVFVDAARGQANECVGCHAVSRDGAKIAFGIDDGVYRIFDVASRTPVFSSGSVGAGMSLFSFSGDGAKLLFADEQRIGVQDATSGAILAASVATDATMPDWSGDGRRLTYVSATCDGDACTDYGVEGGSVRVADFDGAALSNSTTLASGGNNYYPSFSPDGAWILYNHADGGHSYDNYQAKVQVVPADGGESITLTQASFGGDSWPKWAPFVQEDRGGQRMWFTFSSRRPMGLRPAAEDQEGIPVAQIWMASFDPAAAASGADPSTSAFWLPFQESTSGNHIAQWTTEVDRQSCDDASDCETDELCENGRCLPAVD